MTDEEAFIERICERPEDDGPRLVFADYLEETGIDCPRAEFIRVQIDLEHRRTKAKELYRRRYLGDDPLPDSIAQHIDFMPCGRFTACCCCRLARRMFGNVLYRSSELFHEHRAEWFPTTSGSTRHLQWPFAARRGFADELHMDFSTFIHWYPVIKRHHPIRMIHIVGERPVARACQSEGQDGWNFQGVEDLATWRSLWHVQETIREPRPRAGGAQPRDIVAALLVLNWPNLKWSAPQIGSPVRAVFDDIEITGIRVGDTVYVNQVLNRGEEDACLCSTPDGGGIQLKCAARRPTTVRGTVAVLPGQTLFVVRNGLCLGSFTTSINPIGLRLRDPALPCTILDVYRDSNLPVGSFDPKDVKDAIRRAARRARREPRRYPSNEQHAIAFQAGQILLRRRQARTT